MFRRYPVLSVLTVLYLVGVAGITLGPEPYDARTSGVLWRFLDFFSQHEQTHWITFDRVESVANIVMFVPLGLFFVLLVSRRRWWIAALLCVGVSVAIELSQGAFLPTRVSDGGDILANSTGGIIGVLVGIVLMSISVNRRRHRNGGRVRPTHALG